MSTENDNGDNGDNGGTEQKPLLDVRISELAQAHGIGEGKDRGPMTEQDDPFICEVNDHITVAVNNDEARTIGPDDCMGVDAEPFRMIVWVNGWLSYLGPSGGSLVGGSKTEDEIIAAIDETLEEMGYEMRAESEGDSE